MAKWINFKIIKDNGVTKIWEIKPKKEELPLGFIKWYPPWRKYAFFPVDDTLYEPTCLRDIAKFIEGQMQARRKG